MHSPQSIHNFQIHTKINRFDGNIFCACFDGNSFIGVIFVGKKSLDRQWIGPRLVWDKYLSTRSVLDRQTKSTLLVIVFFFQQTYRLDSHLRTVWRCPKIFFDGENCDIELETIMRHETSNWACINKNNYYAQLCSLIHR